MKVLVIGGGGREHAVCAALKKSPLVDSLICAPGNGGISQIAECAPVAATDIPGMLGLARSRAVDFVVVTPDDPLALGMADAFAEAGIPAFGPFKNAALIESSKVFSKGLMKKYGIPTAEYESFTDPEKALAYIREKGAPIVVKADGLALGKGVVVARTPEEAQEAVLMIMRDRKFGDAGVNVVIEECLTGPELTVLCFTDGKTIKPMLSSRDHKPVFDNDMGPNTGGMGAICPVPDYTPELAELCMRDIFIPTMEAMSAEGRTFRGVLYFGLMLTADGPKVIEYNSRFGDPETQAVLPLLETDLMEIFLAVYNGRLGELDIKWSGGSCCCVVMASGGYPGAYEKGFEISGLEEAGRIATVYHAGTAIKGGRFVTAGGRVLGVTAVAGTPDDARQRAYDAVRLISWDGCHYRRDIGGRKL